MAQLPDFQSGDRPLSVPVRPRRWAILEWGTVGFGPGVLRCKCCGPRTEVWSNATVRRQACGDRAVVVMEYGCGMVLRKASVLREACGIEKGVWY
eukprot:3668878-Rhodomonas_salina.1